MNQKIFEAFVIKIPMESSNEKMIYFITGASGVGKTALVSALREKFSHMQWAFLHFDSIGVPSESEMKKEFGSGSGWQEAKTYEWIDTIIGSFDHNKIFLEVQVNLEFIQKGFQKHNFTNYKIILVECSEKEMTHRLINNRKQPELFNNNMRNWLKYLRTQAERFGTIIIDTSNLSNADVLHHFTKAIQL